MRQELNRYAARRTFRVGTAEQSDATTCANASLTLSSSAAAADYNYISLAATGLATAAKTYADHLADLAQTKADARAQAQRDLTVNQDMPAYQNALDEADQDYEDDLSGYEQTYKSSAGSGLSTEMKAKATAHLTYANQVVPQAHTRRTTADGAAYTFQAAASAQYAWLTQQQAQLDASYWQAKTASLSTLAASFASTQGSPWAAFYASQMSTYDDWSQTAAPAQEQRQIAVSRAQAGVDENGNPTAGGEIGMQDAERDLLDAAADADEGMASDLADSAYSREAAAADMAGLMLSSGFLPATLPLLEDTSHIEDTFAISPPGQLTLPGFIGTWLIGSSPGTTVQDPMSSDTSFQYGNQFLAYGSLTSAITSLAIDWNLSTEIGNVGTIQSIASDELFGPDQIELISPNADAAMVSATSIDPLEIDANLVAIAEDGPSPSVLEDVARALGTVNLNLSTLGKSFDNMMSAIRQAYSHLPPGENLDPPAAPVAAAPAVDAPLTSSGGAPPAIGDDAAVSDVAAETVSTSQPTVTFVPFVKTPTGGIFKPGVQENGTYIRVEKLRVGQTSPSDYRPGTWQTLVLNEVHDTRTGAVTKIMLDIPLDAGAANWVAEQAKENLLEREIEKIAKALSGVTLGWKELEQLSKNDRNFIFVPNMRWGIETFGFPRVGYSAVVQRVRTDFGYINVVWARTGRPGDSGELVGRVAFVNRGNIDGSAEKHFTNVEAAFTRTKIETVIQTVLLAVQAASISRLGGLALAAERAAEGSEFGLFGFIRPAKSATPDLQKFYLAIVDTPEFARDVALYNRFAKALGLTEAATITEIRTALLNETTFARVSSNFNSAVFQGSKHSFETRFLLQGNESSLQSLFVGPTSASRAARHELIHIGAALRGQGDRFLSELAHDSLVHLATTPEVPGVFALMVIGGVYIYVSNQ